MKRTRPDQYRGRSTRTRGAFPEAAIPSEITATE